ncbi:GIY-YIG nuclease family protein [Candidatus Peregrinibacteria bacterium]|nr:GIY-YIG nuclease family protein [Candidatus Peregrinibacteria bacterium]
MPYHVYLARCADGSLYTGWCLNLAEREAAHNAGIGAKYTRSRLPIHIVYHETCRTRGAALRREAEIKRWTKAYKEKLIGSMGKRRLRKQ